MAIEVRNDVSPYAVGAMALQTGANVYRQTQNELARREQMAYDEMAMRDMAQQRQIAAQQQSQMFGHFAGQQDTAQRFALGEMGAANQFGRQVAMDERNFGQQKDFAEFNAGLEDRQWETRLNMQGKAAKAKADAERAALDKYFGSWGPEESLTPYQRGQKQKAYAQHAAMEAGVKDERNFLPDPPNMEQILKDTTHTDKDGRIWAMPDGPKLMKDSDAITDKHIARDLEVEKIASQTKIATARIAKRATQAAAFDKDDDRRAAAYDKLYDKYSEQMKLDENGLETGERLYNDEEAHRKATEEAERRVPDSRAQQQQFEQDYDEYRDWWANRDSNLGQQLPEDFDELSYSDQRRIQNEIAEYKRHTQAGSPGFPTQDGRVPQPEAAPQAAPPTSANAPRGDSSFIEAEQEMGTGVAPKTTWAEKVNVAGFGRVDLRDTSARGTEGDAPWLASRGEKGGAPSKGLSGVARAQDLANRSTYYEPGSDKSKAFAKKAIEEIKATIPAKSVAPVETIEAMIAILRRAGIPDSAIAAAMPK